MSALGLNVHGQPLTVHCLAGDDIGRGNHVRLKIDGGLVKALDHHALRFSRRNTFDMQLTSGLNGVFQRSFAESFLVFGGAGVGEESSSNGLVTLIDHCIVNHLVASYKKQGTDGESNQR